MATRRELSLLVISMMLMAHGKIGYSLESTTQASATPILSLCQPESPRTSSESVVIFHPVHKTSTVTRGFPASLARTSYLPGTGNGIKKLANPSTSPQYLPKDLHVDEERKPRPNWKGQSPEDQNGTVDKTAPSEAIQAAEVKHDPRDNGGGMRGKRAAGTGIACSCSIRPEGDTPARMSVMVTFYRLDSTAAGKNAGTTESYNGAHRPEVTCPKLSLVYDGAKVQPLACLGLDSKSVTSFRLPPIRLRQLGIKLATDPGASDADYYAAFVVNVTASASGIIKQYPDIPGSTTIGGIGGDQPPGTGSVTVTAGAVPNGGRMNNGLGAESRGSAAAPTIDGQNLGKIDVTKGGGAIPGTLSSPVSSLASSSSSSSSSSSLLSPPSSTSTLAPRTHPTDDVWHTSSSPALCGNESVSVAVELLVKSDREGDNDSSRVILVAVLTSLTVTSVVVGLVFYLCRLHRIRQREMKDGTSTGHTRVPPYRAISLSRLLRRVSSGGAVHTHDRFEYPPRQSHRVPGKSITTKAMNNERKSHLDTYQYGDGQYRQGDIALKKCDRNNVLSTMAKPKVNNVNDLSKKSDRDGDNNNSGNCAEVNNSLWRCEGLERVEAKTPMSDPINALDPLQVAPPVPPRRRQTNDNTHVTNTTHPPTLVHRRDLPDALGKRDKQTKEVQIPNTQSTHSILPITGVRLPYLDQPTGSRDGDIIVENDSEGKYSIARETRSTRLKHKSLGRLFMEFWSSRVFGRMLKSNENDSDRKKRRRSRGSISSRGYWTAGDVGKTMDEASSDGYESYVEKSENKLSNKGYPTYDSTSGNYEAAKVYIHKENQESDDSKVIYDQRGSNPDMQDFESISDGYDNFMIAQECGNPDCERSRKDFTKVMDNAGGRHDIFRSYGFKGQSTVQYHSPRSTDRPIPFDGNREFLKTENSNNTIKYAEPNIKPRKRTIKSRGDIKDGFYIETEKNSPDILSRMSFKQTSHDAKSHPVVAPTLATTNNTRKDNALFPEGDRWFSDTSNTNGEKTRNILPTESRDLLVLENGKITFIPRDEIGQSKENDKNSPERNLEHTRRLSLEYEKNYYYQSPGVNHTQSLYLPLTDGVKGSSTPDDVVDQSEC